MRQDLLNVQQGFRAAVYFWSICAGTEYNCAAIYILKLVLYNSAWPGTNWCPIISSDEPLVQIQRTDRQRDRQINDRQKNIIEKHSNPQKIEFAPERLGSKRERQFKLFINIKSNKLT